jgi:hypothetical protein
MWQMKAENIENNGCSRSDALKVNHPSLQFDIAGVYFGKTPNKY